MFTNLIHTLTDKVHDLWTILVTHPEITIPGTVVLVGTMLIVNRKTRSN